MLGILIIVWDIQAGVQSTEPVCFTGWTYENFLKRLAIKGWAFSGVFAGFLYTGLTMEKRELAFGFLDLI